MTVRSEVLAVECTMMILWDVMPPDFPDKPVATAFRVEEQSHLEMDTMYGSRFKALRLGWFGHVHRMPDSRTVKKIFNWTPLTARSKGRPKQRWEDNIIQDIRQLNIKNWTVCVQDRTKWKNVVEKAKTFNKRS